MFVRAQKSGLYETEGHNLAKTSVSHRHTLSLRFNIPEVPEIVCKKKKKKKKWDKKKKNTLEAGGGTKSCCWRGGCKQRAKRVSRMEYNDLGINVPPACLKKLNTQQLVFLRN